MVKWFNVSAVENSRSEGIRLGKFCKPCQMLNVAQLKCGLSPLKLVEKVGANRVLSAQNHVLSVLYLIVKQKDIMSQCFRKLSFCDSSDFCTL